jgi:O-antigen/teichoic acid export membrane protein
MGALDDGGLVVRARRDIVAAVARHALSVGAGVLTIAMLGRGLGRSALGAWALIGTSATLISLADLGLSSVALKHSICDEEGTVAARSVALSQWTTLLLAPVFAALSYWVYLSELRGAIDASVASSRALSVAGAAALLAGSITAYSSAQRAWLVGKGATRALAAARASGALAQVTLTAVGLWLRWGIAAPALGVLGSSVIESLMVARSATWIDARVRVVPRGFPRVKEWREAVRESSAALAINAAAVLAVRVDVAVLARVAPLAAVGAYQVSLRVTDQLFTLVKQVGAAMQHRLGTRQGRDETLTFGTIVMTSTFASAVIALAFCGRALLRAWAGPVVDESIFGLSLALTGLGAVVAMSSELASAGLNVAARSQWSGARPHILGSVANAAITLGGASYLGVWAVAGGTIVGNAVIAILTYRSLLALNQTSARAQLVALAPIAAPVLVSFVLGALLAPRSLTVLGSLVACSITGIAAAATLWITLRRASAQETECTSLSLQRP